jgi:chromosome segregation ATPase
VTVNYNPRMEKEPLRQQFEDMEEASERWRSERRRLNDEIDKLESALADAKTEAPQKRPASSEQKPTDTGRTQSSKLQEAAPPKNQKPSEEWNAERLKLETKINHLESAVVEAIDRAANPMRAVQSVREQFESELQKVVKEKNELEQTYLRGKTGWEQEKLKMVGEMVKLRRYAQTMGRPMPRTNVPEANPKVRDLENQLKESFARWNGEREQLSAQIQALHEASHHWDTERRQLNNHAGQLQEAFLHAEAKIKSAEVAARLPHPAEAQVDELRRQNEGLQDRARETQSAWDSERSRMAAQIDQLQQQLLQFTERRESTSSEDVDQLRQHYEQRLQEAIQQKAKLAEDLEAAGTLLESERARLSAAQAHSGSGNTPDEAIRAEVARVEGQVSQILAAMDDPNTPLPAVIRKNVEKAELDSYLKGILFSLGKR